MTNWPSSLSVSLSVSFFSHFLLFSSMLHSLCDTMSLLWGTCSPLSLLAAWKRAALLYGLLKSPGDVLSPFLRKVRLEDKGCKRGREERSRTGWERKEKECKNKVNTLRLSRDWKTINCRNWERHSGVQHLAPFKTLMHFAVSSTQKWINWCI